MSCLIFLRKVLEDLIKIVSDTLANDTDNGIKVSCLRTLAELEVKPNQNIIEVVKTNQTM